MSEQTERTQPSEDAGQAAAGVVPGRKSGNLLGLRDVSAPMPGQGGGCGCGGHGHGRGHGDGRAQRPGGCGCGGH